MFVEWIQFKLARLKQTDFKLNLLLKSFTQDHLIYLFDDIVYLAYNNNYSFNDNIHLIDNLLMTLHQLEQT